MAYESIRTKVDIGENLSDLLDACLSEEPRKRPKIDEIKIALKRKLVKGKHKATIVIDHNVYVLKDEGKGVRISRGGIDSATILYNGYEFKIQDIEGDVYVNNMKINEPENLPGSSVITLGAEGLRAGRKFSTFDISHPEVIL